MGRTSEDGPGGRGRARALSSRTPHDRFAPWRPSPASERLARLVRFRARLVARAAEIRARDARGDGREEEPLVRRCLDEELALLDRQLAGVDREIAAATKASPKLAERAARLKSAPGVGPILAATLLADLPKLGTASGRQIAALVGVALFDRQSGNRRRRSKCEGGRGSVRRTLHMGVVAAIRGRNRLAEKYKALRGAGKTSKVAIVAVMRKLLVALNAMVRDGREWA